MPSWDNNLRGRQRFTQSLSKSTQRALKPETSAGRTHTASPARTDDPCTDTTGDDPGDDPGKERARVEHDAAEVALGNRCQRTSRVVSFARMTVAGTR